MQSLNLLCTHPILPPTQFNQLVDDDEEGKKFMDGRRSKNAFFRISSTMKQPLRHSRKSFETVLNCNDDDDDDDDVDAFSARHNHYFF